MLRQYLWPATLAAIAVAVTPLAVGNPASAGSPADAFGLFETIPVPPTGSNTTSNALYSFDISWVDQATRLYYLADRSNKAVDIVDTATNTLIAQIDPTPKFPPFRGFTACSPPAGANDCAGPNGVVTSGHCLFVTDAPSRLVSFDTTGRAFKPVSDVHLDPTDPTRADELAVSPYSLILAINNASTPPFGTWVKFDAATCALTPPDPTTNRITLDAAHGVDAKNGAEQPIWDPGTGKFYLSIPQIGSTPTNGGVVRIASNATSVNPNPFPMGDIFGVTFCSPAGLTKGPSNDALVGCNTIWDTTGGRWTGNADKDIHTAAPIQVILNLRTGDQFRVGGVGVGDEVTYNREDGNYYTASSGSPLVPNAITPARPPLGTAATAPTLTAQGAAILGVIDATHGQVLQLVPTFNVPAVVAPDTDPHPAGTAHSVAVDAESSQVFVPLAANNVYPDCLTGCIAVYARGAPEQPIEAVLPPK